MEAKLDDSNFSLNDYLSRNDFKNTLILLAICDEGSVHLNKITAGFEFLKKYSLSFRSGFAMIYDSDSGIETYEIGKTVSVNGEFVCSDGIVHNLLVESCGFMAGITLGYARFYVDGKLNTCIENRGLNVCIISKDDFAVKDLFCVDTFNDPSLTIKRYTEENIISLAEEGIDQNALRIAADLCKTGRAGTIDDSIRYLNKLVSLNPKYRLKLLQFVEERNRQDRKSIRALSDQLLLSVGQMSSSESAQVYHELGMMYFHGECVNRNIDYSINLLRKAVAQDIEWSNELFDVLWKINTPKSNVEMVVVAELFAEHGNFNAMGRLGRAYHDGRGVKKDLNKAAEWMRKATLNSSKWSSELFDVLWDIGSPETDAEMITLAEKYASQGDGAAMLRLGRAYRNGRGVPKDLDKSEVLMKDASAHGILDAELELFDMLFATTRYENWSKAVARIRPLASAGNALLQRRLGLAFWKRKGVELDLNEASVWMKKAADQNFIYAMRDYYDILLEIGTEESLTTAIAYALPSAESGNISMQKRLGQAYLYGIGVEMNLHESALWLSRAYVKDSYDDKDLFKVLRMMNNSESHFLLEQYASQGNLRAKALLLDYATSECSVSESAATKMHSYAEKINHFQTELMLPYYSGNLNADYAIDRVICGCATDEELIAFMKNIKDIDSTTIYVHELQSTCLEFLIKLCDKLGLPIIVSCGTLLGAYRHDAIIPWDDDVDTDMFLADIEKLSNYLSLHNSSFWICKFSGCGVFYKMKSKLFGDEMWIDIFPLETHLYAKDSELVQILPHCIRNVIGSDIIYGSTKDTHPTSVNVYFKESDLFPLEKHKMNNIEVYIPHNTHKYLKRAFGDYMSLPSTSYVHMDEEQKNLLVEQWNQNKNEVVKEINRILSAQDYVG